MKATGRLKSRAITPTRRWPTATPIRCARRCSVTWPRQSWNTPRCGPVRIQELGGPEPVYTGSPAGEADSLANRAGGTKMALRRLEIEESRDIARYGTQLKELGDEGSLAILEHVIEDEKEHHSELGSLLRGHYMAPAGAPKIDPKAVLEESPFQAQPGP